jgi:RNA polymerase sigma-70 factor (ECF subfamily)
LPAGQREAIRLLKIEEKSLKEASAESGMSVASLKVSVHRAIKALKTIMEGKNEKP